jgi:hypothetical protein
MSKLWEERIIPIPTKLEEFVPGEKRGHGSPTDAKTQVQSLIYSKKQ